jgi:hypothetical protein
MKINPIIFALFLLSLASCKKSETTPTPQQDSYLDTSAGNTWNYHVTDSSGIAPVIVDYTLTSTSRDSLINGRNYHVFTNSVGSNDYFNNTGNDYYQFDSLPAGLGVATFERLYLKDNVAVGSNWTQTLSVTLPAVPIPVPVTLTNTVVEKGISKTVNGTSYSDVIHIQTSISSALIPSAALISDINTYYAKRYGLIQTRYSIQLDFMGITENVNTETYLASATLR